MFKNCVFWKWWKIISDFHWQLYGVRAKNDAVMFIIKNWKATEKVYVLKLKID